MNFWPIFSFWLVIQVFTLIGFPITFQLLKNLPDRGYALAKPVGILFVGYTLWLLTTFGFLRNNLGGTLIAAGLVLAFAIVWNRRQTSGYIFAWLKDNRGYVLSVEAIFSVAFIAWAFFKAYNPNIETAGGEKWMEIAFINSNLLSANFPPQDPWLSGFGISYYYFGYLFMAMLIRLSGLVSTTAFNLLIPALLGLTLIGAFGIVANLVAIFERSRPDTKVEGGGTTPYSLSVSARLTGALGALFVALLGHWEGLLEVIHSRGLLPAWFWIWLDIRDLKIPPDGPGPWIPDRFIWWWRGSRVLTDYNLAGREQEVIDEIPAFSFLLGDVHPHVMTLPFVLLAVALALNLFLQNRTALSTLPTTNPISLGWYRLQSALGGAIGVVGYLLCFGALGFLNTWDLPIYLAVLGLTYLAWRGSDSLVEVVGTMVGFALLGAMLYLPFYVGFRSQAGGILPNMWNPTRLPQLIVFFGPFFVAIISFLIVYSKMQAAKQVLEWRRNLRWSVPLSILGPIFLLILLVFIFIRLPSGQQFIQGVLADPAVQANIGGGSQRDLMAEVVSRRLGNPWAFLFLGLLLAWTVAHFWRQNEPDVVQQPDSAERFVVILLLIGLLLPLSVEFVYLRDNFGYRMNTIFKFYFQAWVLLGLASAFGVYYVAQMLVGSKRLVWQGAVTLVILAAMAYPVLAVFDKANYFRGEPTLDGIAWIERVYPDDYAAILWLRENAPTDAVILEAPSQGYDSYGYEARISALTGRAALLGWGGHQSQWRGNFDEPGRRHPDIEAIYNGLDSRQTLALLDKYNVTYVYVGPIERQRYNPTSLAKFNALLEVAFVQGDVIIYQRPTAQN